MKYIFGFALVFFAACSTPSVHDTALFNDAATLDTLPVDPLQWKALSVFTNTKTLTQSTLYANDTAFAYARTHSDHAYPAQAQLALVTWEQQNDPHWLGARMAAQVKSVELIIFGNGAKPVYTRYEGHPLKAATTGADTTRMTWILQQPALPVP